MVKVVSVPVTVTLASQLQQDLIGHVFCPACGERNHIVLSDDGSVPILDLQVKCEHANMVVSTSAIVGDGDLSLSVNFSWSIA